MRRIGQFITLAVVGVMATAAVGQSTTGSLRSAGQSILGSTEALKDALAADPDHQMTLKPGEHMNLRDKNGRVIQVGSGQNPIRMTMTTATAAAITSATQRTTMPQAVDLKSLTPELRAHHEKRIQEHRARIQQLLRQHHAQKKIIKDGSQTKP